MVVLVLGFSGLRLCVIVLLVGGLLLVIDCVVYWFWVTDVVGAVVLGVLCL